MSIVSHVKMGLAIPSAVPERVARLWAENLKARAPEVYQRIIAVVPDETKFYEVIANLANLNWMPFVAPGFVSESGQDKGNIVRSHADKLKTSYDKWIKQLNHVFETVDGIPAKRFIERVELNQSEFQKAMSTRVLPFTGLKVEGRGPAPKAALWLTGNQKVIRMMGGGEILEGGPYLVCPRTKIPGLRAMLVQRLIQAGNNIIKANYDSAVMAAENQKTAEEIQGFVDPGLDLIPFVGGSPDSHVDYILGENKQLYLEIKVSKM